MAITNVWRRMWWLWGTRFRAWGRSTCQCQIKTGQTLPEAVVPALDQGLTPDLPLSWVSHTPIQLWGWVSVWLVGRVAHTPTRYGRKRFKLSPLVYIFNIKWNLKKVCVLSLQLPRGLGTPAIWWTEEPSKYLEYHLIAFNQQPKAKIKRPSFETENSEISNHFLPRLRCKAAETETGLFSRLRYSGTMQA